MGLKPTFTRADVARALKLRTNRIETALINRLHFLGEKCLAECRTNKTYMDRSGNLTSSMGYIVAINGKPVQIQGFDKKLEGEIGTKTGSSLAKEVAAQFTGGYSLIVVAGMDYAAHVEAMGRNVLASAELLAEREAPRMLRELTRNINRP